MLTSTPPESCGTNQVADSTPDHSLRSPLDELWSEPSQADDSFSEVARLVRDLTVACCCGGDHHRAQSSYCELHTRVNNLHRDTGTPVTEQDLANDLESEQICSKSTTRRVLKQAKLARTFLQAYPQFARQPAAQRMVEQIPQWMNSLKLLIPFWLTRGVGFFTVHSTEESLLHRHVDLLDTIFTAPACSPNFTDPQLLEHARNDPDWCAAVYQAVTQEITRTYQEPQKVG